MPDIQKFIYSLVHRITNGTCNKRKRKCDGRTNRSAGKETSGTESKSGIEGIAEQGNSGIQGISEQGEFSRRNLQAGFKLQVESGEDKEGAFSAYRGNFKERSSSEGNASNASKASEQQPKAPLISFSLFLFSNYNSLVILQAIDDICYHVNPILLGAMFK